MRRKENQRKKFEEIQSQYEKIKEQEAKLRKEEKNRTSKNIITPKISSSNLNDNFILNNNNTNTSFLSNYNNNNNIFNNNIINNNINNKSNNNQLISNYLTSTPIINNEKKYNNKFQTSIENEYKKQSSFPNVQNQEKEVTLFEENSNKQDKSFDYGTTYQKKIPSGFSNQNIGTRSTKALIYSKKGIRTNSNEKNNLSMINYTNNSNFNTTTSFNSINSGNKKIYENNNKRNNMNNSINYNKINYTNSSNLNNSFQEPTYKKCSTIYCRSPGKYSNPKANLKSYNNNNNIRYSKNNDYEKLNNSVNQINNTSYSNNKSQNNFYSSNNQNSLSINLEDLIVLEEKLSEIINALNTNKYMSNECFEWWNYYFNCSLYGHIEKCFIGNDSNIIKSSINYSLFSIMLCYDISFDRSLITKVFIMIKAILNLNHRNLIIICEYILSKISNESLSNIWVYKLRDLINSMTSNIDESEYVSFNIQPLSSIEKIKYNTNCISSDIKIILKNYPFTQLTENLITLYKNISEKTYEEINRFFREKILRVENPNASVLASFVLKENSNFYTVSPPYLKTKNLKKYSLVLDLDETIIHFKVNPNNDSEGVLRVRPGIYEFLEKLGKYYEIIVFTAATQDYADLLIDAIEENKIYFDYRLYRQHAIIFDNDFVKDLNRLGRPIDKIIIVDNMPQNFRLQKDNGINIRAFWGEDPYDTALIDLCPILINIAKEGGDVRVGLRKYRDEIVRKVTSNISKH